MTPTERPASTRPRPLRRDAAQNREKVLRAAWEVFAELGPDAGVEEIARRAGVGMGTLYRRFPTKESLLAALSEEILDALLNIARRATAEQPKSRALEEALWESGEVLAQRHGWLTRLWGILSPDTDERRAELYTLLNALLDQAKDAGEVRHDLALTDIYLCFTALRSVIDGTTNRAPNAWRRHLAIILAGFRPSTEPLAHPAADDTLMDAETPKHRAS